MSLCITSGRRSYFIATRFADKKTVTRMDRCFFVAMEKGLWLWRGSFGGAGGLQKRGHLFDDLGVLVIEVCRLAKVGLQVVELCGGRVLLDLPIFDVAVFLFGQQVCRRPAAEVAAGLPAPPAAALDGDVDPVSLAD